MRAIRERPEQTGPYLELAGVYTNRGQLDAAARLLEEGLKAAPGDPALRQAHSDVQVARLQRAIATCDRKVRERPDDDATAARLAQLTELLAEYEAAIVGRGGDAGNRSR